MEPASLYENQTLPVKTGLVITVKNEVELLRWNLLYHRFGGVDKVFIYDDGATDDTVSSISDLPFVSVNKSISEEYFKNKRQLKIFREKSNEQHTARQCLNFCHAMESAEKYGLDWLISLDADELVCVDVNRQESGFLSTFFGKMAHEVDCVRMSSLEIVQRKDPRKNIFFEEDIFQSRAMGVRRKIFNPYKKKYHHQSGFLGHTMGKCAVRTGRGIIPKNVHRFVLETHESIVTQKEGHILHYDIFSAENFIKKFKNFSNHPDFFIYGDRVDFFKVLWRNIVNDPNYSREYLVSYYQNNIGLSDKYILKNLKHRNFFFQKKKPILFRIFSVIKNFKQFEENFHQN